MAWERQSVGASKRGVSTLPRSDAPTLHTSFHRRHLLPLGDFLFGQRRALSKEGDPFEQVHRPIELRVVRAGHTRAIFFIQTLDATRRALKYDIALFFLR